MEKRDLLGQVKEDAAKKIAIALSANANHGKTSILKALTDIFRSKESVSLVDMRSMENCRDEMWCFEEDGVRIGIATGGDDADLINMAFDFFKKNECRIVFCATRYYSNSPSWGQFVARCESDRYESAWQGVDAHTSEVLKIMHLDVAENVLSKMLYTANAVQR